VVVPTAVYALAFWGLSLPLAYRFGVVEGGGAPGLLTGMLAGLVAASLLLALRFLILARRAGGRA